MRSQKFSIKKFFGASGASESAVELLQMFILPFSRMWDSKASVDDALAAFFATEDRKIQSGRARINFLMPGLWMREGGMPKKRYKNRSVKAGTELLIVVDRKDQTAKIDVLVGGVEHTFLLTRGEFEYLKDKVVLRA